MNTIRVKYLEKYELKICFYASALFFQLENNL